jgi:hypothetical protein
MSNRPSELSSTEFSSGRERRVFFSFHYGEDKDRASVVSNSWPNFVDSGTWQEAKELGDESIKRLICLGVDQTSVTCVLVGAHTWRERWTRYEIARSVEQGKGIVAVRIDGIADKQTKQPSFAGWNPLAHIGVGKAKNNKYFLFENINGQWMRYQDHQVPLVKPIYLPDMTIGYVHPLSVALLEFDYVRQNGPENLTKWIDAAAQKIAKQTGGRTLS